MEPLSPHVLQRTGHVRIGRPTPKDRQWSGIMIEMAAAAFLGIHRTHHVVAVPKTSARQVVMDIFTASPQTDEES